MTAHTKCSICNEDIVLIPSAQQRSISTGQPESYFLNLFTTHSECFIKERRKEFHELVIKLNDENKNRFWRYTCKLNQYQKLNIE